MSAAANAAPGAAGQQRRAWLRLAILLLLVAAVAHLLVVRALPKLIMARLAAAAPAESRGPGAVYFPPMTDHRQRRVVLPSPDLLYAICPFDVRQRPLHIQAHPQAPGYWSVALYGENSDNFFVLNDRQAAGQPVNLLLVASQPDARPPAVPAGATVVTAPGGQGLLLMRVLVSDYAAEREVVEAARRTLRCTPL